MTFDEVRNADQSHIMATYNRFPVAIASGHGAVAVDVNGREYVDFTSGIGVNSLGYADEGWVKAVSRQLTAVSHISNLYYSPVQASLARSLCEKTGFSKVLFCNSGAEANECAIKLARKHSYDAVGEGKSKIITLKNSFHGRTMATLTATGQDAMHNYFFPFLEGFAYVKAGDLEALSREADETACAVMLELVQGEGGVIPLSRDFVEQAARFCRERNLLLIVDEVQTGVGRTGKLLACEHYGLKPDIVTLAKGLGGGLPIGACLCGETVKDAFTPGTHGTTFGGNLAVCAGAAHVLERVTTPDFLDEVTQKGRYLKERLAAMPMVESVSGLGMMLGVEVAGQNGPALAARCVEAGLLILTAKQKLRLLPPLTITYDEIDRGLAILGRVLREGKEGN